MSYFQPSCVCEKLSFAKLYNVSEPKRVLRAQTVRGPPLDIQANTDGVYYNFNFKSFPSTTGNRQRGYIKFFKPKNKNTPLENIDCLVDCTCFSADAKVLMADGTRRRIADVKVGEFVYTHKGRPRRVTRNMPRQVKPGEKVYKVDVTGGQTMTVTGNHPFYTLRGNDECLCGCGAKLPTENLPTPKKLLTRGYLTGHHRKPKQKLVQDQSCGVFQWVKVDDFRSKEWFLAPWLEHTPTPGVEVDLDFARLIGYCAAEGWAGGRGRQVRLAFNKTEEGTLVKDVVRICARLALPCQVRDWRRTAEAPATGLDVRITSAELKAFVTAHVGVGAANLKLSDEIMSWPLPALRELYLGFQLGDGSVAADGGTRCFSVSEPLMSQLSTILWKLGIGHTLNEYDAQESRLNTYVISIKQSQAVEKVLSLIRLVRPLEFVKAPHEPYGLRRSEGELRLLQSREEIEFDELVYDLTVDEDESFICEGIAVHNCPDYRYRWAWVNKQKGSSVVGNKSLNQSLNRAPRITNPRGRAGLCKHLLALRDFVFGEYEVFDGTDLATPEKLDAVVQRAQTRAATPAPKKVGPKADVKDKPPLPADKKPGAPTPPPPLPKTGTVKPTATTRGRTVPQGFVDQTMQRFTGVESVGRVVNELAQLLKETEDVQVDPEASEALQLLREIRDGIKALVAKDKDEEPAPDEAPAKEAEDDGPAPEDLPAPET